MHDRLSPSAPAQRVPGRRAVFIGLRL